MYEIMGVQLNVDSVIFVVFLVTNLIFGLASSRGIKNIKEYAIGDRNFSTITLTSTLVATWIGGEVFFNYLSETYKHGLYFMWASGAGNVLCFFLVSLIFAPRMSEFLGKLSIAEAMGDMYGKHVRVITAIAGFIGACGLIAIQLKVAGFTVEYCFGISSAYGILISGIIITLYSTFGGIKSVTFTDVIQLFTFGTIIPTIAYFILSSITDVKALTEIFVNNKLFDYKEVFDFTRPKSLYHLFYFFFIVIPAFNPAIFQRIAMARDIKQVQRSFVVAGFSCLLLTMILAWVGILVLSTKSNLDPNEVAKHIIFDYSVTGMRGMILVGIMAMVMSTADSYVNSTSVLVSHDFCKPLGIGSEKNELTFSRVTSLIIGLGSMFMALRSSNLIQLMISANTLYMPIVTVPFIMSVFGFRSSSKSVLIGMGAGFVAVAIWEFFLRTGDIDGLIPGMVANLVFLIGSHYVLRQPGGWVGIKDDKPLQEIRRRRKEAISRFIDAVKGFKFIAFCKKNSPRQEGMYTYFGLFCIISVYATMHTIPKPITILYSSLINFVYPSVFFAATVLISYPLWLSKWKNKGIVAVLWNLIIFYVLICVGFLLVIISNFAEMQLMVFLVNIVIIAALVRWQWALCMLVVGPLLTLKIFKYYLGINALPENFVSLEFKIVYLLLLLITILILFLKPKQEEHELVEKKAEYLTDRAFDREEETRKAQELKYEFLRNIEHELQTPITSITNFAQTLNESYDKLNDKQRRVAISEVAKGAERLGSLADNIINLSRLLSIKAKLNLSDVNLTRLTYDRIEICKKIYNVNPDEQDFVTNIESNIIVNCDEYYIKQTLDNLIINAIQYCKDGKISVSLKKTESGGIEFSIEDEGIGIPPSDLYDVFGAFTVSSKTKSIAGGRGIGLALCKKVIELHHGRIWAESDGKKGSIFKFVL